MAIIKVKERQIEVKKGESPGEYYEATVRDGEITELGKLDDCPSLENIRAYIDFLHEVAEAIKETL